MLKPPVIRLNALTSIQEESKIINPGTHSSASAIKPEKSVAGSAAPPPRSSPRKVPKTNRSHKRQRNLDDIPVFDGFGDQYTSMKYKWMLMLGQHNKLSN